MFFFVVMCCVYGFVDVCFVVNDKFEGWGGWYLRYLLVVRFLIVFFDF